MPPARCIGVELGLEKDEPAALRAPAAPGPAADLSLASPHVSGNFFEPDQTLALIGERIAAAGSLGAVVSVLRETARRVVGSDGIAIVLREGCFCHYAAEDAIEPLWQGRRFPLETCISGWVMLHGRTAIVPDIESDPRVPVAAYSTTSMRSLVMVPIGSPVPIAALGAYWCASVIPDADTVARLEALARHAASNVERLARRCPAPAQA